MTTTIEQAIADSKHDCYVLETSGHRPVYTKARVLREGKKTVTVVTINGNELIFNGTRAEAITAAGHSLRERADIYNRKSLSFDVAGCEKRVAEIAAKRDHNRRISNATTEIEKGLRGHQNGTGDYQISDAQLAALEAAAASFKTA